MNRTGKWLGIVSVGVAVLIAPPPAAAAPIATLEYTATSIGGGQFRYDYRLENLADPVTDFGFDIYSLDLDFSSAASFVSEAAPLSGWDIIGGAGFVSALSQQPGSPPTGTDVGPGQFRHFSFVLSGPIGNAAFSVLFTNPLDIDDPVPYNAIAAPGAVPEPTSLALVLSGAACCAARRRRQPLEQPRFRKRPIALHSSGRDTERVDGLSDAEAREEPQFDDLAQALIESGEIGQCLVQGEHVHDRILGACPDVLQAEDRDAPPRLRALLRRAWSTRISRMKRAAIAKKWVRF